MRYVLLLFILIACKTQNLYESPVNKSMINSDSVLLMPRGLSLYDFPPGAKSDSIKNNYTCIKCGGSVVTLEVSGIRRGYDSIILPKRQDSVCPVGYSKMPFLSNSDMTIDIPECLPDSVCKRLWLQWDKDVCYESQFYSGGDKFSRSLTGTWVNDSIGCVSKTVYSEKKNGEWVDISSCRYYFFNNSTCSVSDGKKMTNVPCCGHQHSVEPKE